MASGAHGNRDSQWESCCSTGTVGTARYGDSNTRETDIEPLVWALEPVILVEKKSPQNLDGFSSSPPPCGILEGR
jgi:hypothetical protein